MDFVARNPETDEIVYYQVSYSVVHEDTLRRELEPFRTMHDHHEKILLTTDIHEAHYDGIKQRNVINWLLC